MRRSSARWVISLRLWMPERGAIRGGGLGGLRRPIGRLGAITLAAVTAALALAASAGAAGSIYTVSGYGDGTGSCSPTSASTFVCPTLRAAATGASAGSTIQLSAGTYQLTLGQLQMGAATIQGTGPGGPGGTTIQQTDGAHRVIEVDAGPATLAALEVTGGHLAPSSSPSCSTEPWAGGGILALGTLTLQTVLVTGNGVIAPTASSGATGDCVQGGGIAYSNTVTAQSVIADSIIAGNTATGGTGGSGGGVGGAAEGGAVAYTGTGSLAVKDTTISQNTATGGPGGPGVSGGGKGGAAHGGGIFSTSAVTVSVTGSTVAANTAMGGAEGPGGPTPPPTSSGGPGEGGGIFAQGATEQVVNTTVFGNSAQGGAAATNGTLGAASGGGIYGSGPSGTLNLASVTLDGNGAQQAGNLFVGPAYPFTVHDTIVAAGSPGNCATSASPSSESGNLEDDPGDGCGFTAANHDLVGVNPQLASSPAYNGGVTQTLAPATTSPVLGAGGQCLDPTSTPPGQPLATDQRGQPRSNPCDIGAFEAQEPRGTSRPVISGVTSRGHRLACTSGAWTGDGPFTFAYGWLRDGVAIAGTTSATYLIRAIDAGHTLACRVIATHYGWGASTSALASVIPNPVITLLSVRASGTMAAVALGCRGATGQRCSGVLKLTVFEKLRGNKVIAVAGARPGRPSRTATVARRSYAIAARSIRTLRLGLSGNGLQLLRRFAHLPLTLTLTQTTPRGSATRAKRKLILPPLPSKRRRA